jgi:hypothetical protein
MGLETTVKAVVLSADRDMLNGPGVYSPQNQLSNAFKRFWNGAKVAVECS